MKVLKNIRGFTLVGVVAFAAMASSEANAQASATGTASANAVIAKPISIVSTANLDFGTIVPNSAGAITVTVDTASTTPPTLAGVVDGAWIGGTISSASFTVTGRPAATFAITLPAAGIPINGVAVPANTMTVSGFTDSTAGVGALVVGGTPGLGENIFTVGATLTVPAAQADDTYTGNFNVTVAYN